MIDIDDIYNAIHEYPLLVLWMERRLIVRGIEKMYAFAARLHPAMAHREVLVREVGNDMLDSAVRTAERMESYYDRRYFLEPASGPTKRVAQWKLEQRRYRK